MTELTQSRASGRRESHDLLTTDSRCDTCWSLLETSNIAERRRVIVSTDDKQYGGCTTVCLLEGKACLALTRPQRLAGPLVLRAPGINTDSD